MDDADKAVGIIAKELKIRPDQVVSTIEMLDEGATVPFIARYRKERTGSLDEIQILSIRDRILQLRDLYSRRDAILKSLIDRQLLTPDLQEKIISAETMSKLEDLYLPFKPKRRTRAMIAKEKGLEPFALDIFNQDLEFDPENEALKYIDPEKELLTGEDVLAGARDIMAEWISENEHVRERIRNFFFERGQFKCSVVEGKEQEGQKYRDYFDWEESLRSAPSHRILAMRRGEKEGFINLKVLVDRDSALDIIQSIVLKNDSPSATHVKLALEDGYKRLLSASMETEVRLQTKKRAEEEAIKIFSENLRELLLASPLGEKRLMAIDPGFRTGCKVACLNAQGKFIASKTIYPHSGAAQAAEASRMILDLLKEYRIEAIAVGNGTAGRETEAFLRKSVTDSKISILMVNESGASVYSASEAARKEFPELDLTVRGSISIGRRLMDPLSELVKIDPKSIGVGQYQHDVNQTDLKNRLDDVVVSCVNKVGVEVNTASQELLSYVSGLGPQLASNIVSYRNENGPFPSRVKLKKVPRMGAKAYELSAGFLRIRNGKHPLDCSSVHPESYPIVKQMAKDLNCDIDQLMLNNELVDKIKLEKYVNDKIGLPTLNDIAQELKKPGRDPREPFDDFKFAEGILEIKDLKAGMSLPGIVTNVTAFGAFVDIGVHQDGLVHISQIADRFVKDPNEIVKAGQRVTVRVLQVDADRKRISLSMKKDSTLETGTKGSSRVRIPEPLSGSKKNFKNNPFARFLKNQ